SCAFAPQQESLLELPAQLWLAPRPRNEALFNDATGAGEGLTVPSPSWPAPFAPQHETPDEVSAQVCDWPSATARGPLTRDPAVTASTSQQPPAHFSFPS